MALPRPGGRERRVLKVRGTRESGRRAFLIVNTVSRGSRYSVRAKLGQLNMFSNPGGNVRGEMSRYHEAQWTSCQPPRFKRAETEEYSGQTEWHGGRLVRPLNAESTGSILVQDIYCVGTMSMSLGYPDIDFWTNFINF